jgi:phage major head subunit gpT-like protein
MTTTNLKRITITGRVADDLRNLAAIEQAGWAARLDAIRQSGVPMNAGNVPMVSENWLPFLIPGLRKAWTEGLTEADPTFRRTDIYEIDTSSRAKETFQGVGELGSEAWAQFEKTGRVPYDGFNPLWPYELVHHEFAMGMAIKRKLIDDNLYPDGLRLPREQNAKAAALGRSAALFREKNAVSLFNNAFTDTGVDAFGNPLAGPDGVGLVSTAHKRSPSDATTQSNEFTLALTGPNLTTVRLAMQAFTDDRGHLAPSNPDTLLVPPALEETARIIMESALDPTSAENAINPNRGRYKIVVWPWLTDTNAWFLIDSTKKRQHLVWLDRILPEYRGHQDTETFDFMFNGYMRFSRGWSHWTWIAGSNPS